MYYVLPCNMYNNYHYYYLMLYIKYKYVTIILY